MKISFFQYTPKFMKLEENFNNISSLLDKNKEYVLNSDIIVFPEYFLSWAFSLDYLKEYDILLKNFWLIDKLLKLSIDFSNQTFVMWSIILMTEDGNYYNTSLVLKNGIILTKYYKKALIYNENYICNSNNLPAIFEVNWIKCWISICWDLILPEVYRLYTWKIDLMIIPSFWWIWWNALQSKYKFSLEKKYYTDLWVSRAYENAFALLFVNSVWKYTSPIYNDRMMWWSFLVEPPLWVTYKTNNKKIDFLHTVEIDFENLKKYKEYYATDKDYFYYKEKQFI